MLPLQALSPPPLPSQQLSKHPRSFLGLERGLQPGPCAPALWLLPGATAGAGCPKPAVSGLAGSAAELHTPVPQLQTDPERGCAPWGGLLPLEPGLFPPAMPGGSGSLSVPPHGTPFLPLT